jgi:hypothetical protein
VFVAQNIASPQDPQEQQACATWTEDHKVFAAVSPVNPTIGVLATCLAKRGVPLVGGGLQTYDKQAFDDFADYLYTPDTANFSSFVPAWIDRLAAQGFLSGSPKIGVMRYDTPIYARIADRALKPALARYGQKVAVEFNAADEGGTTLANNAQAAALRFRAEGVTHVLFLEGGGGMPQFFLTFAEQQGYHPRYGFHTLDTPSVLQGSVPPAQLRGALGSGWSTFDVDAAHAPPPNQTRALCRKLMTDAHQDIANPVAAALADSYCDLLLFMKAALDRGGQASVPALRTGADRLNDAFLSGLDHQTRFGAGHHDGPGLARDFSFDEMCTCFQLGAGSARIP